MGHNRRVHLHGGCGYLVLFRCGRYITSSDEYPTNDGAINQDADGRIVGILLFCSER